jgi:hypothetical protein
LLLWGVHISLDRSFSEILWRLGLAKRKGCVGILWESSLSLASFVLLKGIISRLLEDVAVDCASTLSAHGVSQGHLGVRCLIRLVLDDPDEIK